MSHLPNPLLRKGTPTSPLPTRPSGLYGRKVAAGEWRDYAIDFLKDRAVFSVFRRSSEVPIYRIEKSPRQARRQGAYSVISATGLIVRRGHELDRLPWWRVKTDLRRFGFRARAQRSLHQHSVEPAVELESDRCKGSDQPEA